MSIPPPLPPQALTTIIYICGATVTVSPVHAELRKAQRRFLKAFSGQLGVEVERLSLPLLYSSLPIWTASMASVKEGPSFCASMKVKIVLLLKLCL